MENDYDDPGIPTEEDLKACYGSEHLNAEDIGTKKIRTRIVDIKKKMMPARDGKPPRPRLVIWLNNIEKPMVLNATNKDELVAKLGRNPADWKNADIGLFTEPTKFQGKPVQGLRLRVLSPPKAAAKAVPQPAPKPAPQPAAAEEPWPEEKGDPGAEYTEAAE